MADLIICGLFEEQLLKEGWIRKGECRSCVYENCYFDREGNRVWNCDKKGRLEMEQLDCKDWVIDTR